MPPLGRKRRSAREQQKQRERTAVSEGRQIDNTTRVDSSHGVGTSTRLSRKSLRLKRRDEESFVDLQPLIKLTWDVRRVSPLYGFQGGEVRLKQYALNLRNRCTSMKVAENVEYKAEFCVLRGLSSSENDMAMKVEVRCSEEEKPSKIIYFGLLMSWGCPREIPKDFLYLPILLCRGRSTVKNLVHQALQEFFDCVITAYHFTQIDLVWLNGLFLSVSPSERKKESVLKITLAEPWMPSARFEYRLLFSEVKEIWNSIHPEDSDVLTAEEVRILYDGLMEHISQVTELNLRCFKIIEIGYPEVRVNVNGKVACKSMQIFDELLSFFYSELPLINVMNMDFEDSL